MSELQHELQNQLVKRYESLRSERIDPREDNALAITTDGRKLALDARLLSPKAVDHPDSKVNALVSCVTRIWAETTEQQSTQIVFCDLGVNATPWGYSAYEEVTAKLIEEGIPPEQIAAVGEAVSDARKQALFERVRNGSVRVLIGSTQKMGVGTNVQKRLIALHHLDAPWKPAEVEQREGRILRQPWFAASSSAVLLTLGNETKPFTHVILHREADEDLTSPRVAAFIVRQGVTDLAWLDRYFSDAPNRSFDCRPQLGQCWRYDTLHDLLV